MDNKMAFKTVTIESSRFGWGLLPLEGEENFQRLTINDRGSVYFTAYGWGNHDVTRKNRLSIDRDIARHILELLYGFVTNPVIIVEATDVAYWTMKATDETGIVYDTSGPVTNWVEYNGENISNLIRASVPIDDLIVFGEEEEEEDVEDEVEWDGVFYREKPTDLIWWVDTPDRVGEWLFTFDKQKIYNMFRDYPHKLTVEEKEVFDKENPYWRDFFKGRN